MNYDWAFLPMQSSNDLLDTADERRARFEADGRRYFSKLMPAETVMKSRRAILTALGELAPGRRLSRA